MTAVTDRVFTTAQVRELDRVAIQEHGIPGYTLMLRAGQATFDLIRKRWPEAKSLCVLCGAGNNGGDGYVIAKLALQAGWQVSVLALGDVLRLGDDAQQAYSDFQVAGGRAKPFDGELPASEVLVDALFGTGLTRDVEGIYADAIRQINQHPAPVVAVDIPSGLNADTGNPCGCAVSANLTVTFIGWKAGLLTGSARDYCGEICFARLDVPDAVYTQVPAHMHKLGMHTLQTCLPPRQRTTHKGSCGHALLVGGAPGMSGAIRLAGEAALRAGSGLVSIATHSEHAPLLNLTRPELMVNAVDSPVHLRHLLQKMDALGIGPGMGQTAWSRGLLTMVQNADMPKVLDADALNLLAQTPVRRDDWILTPHPAEAARLLACETADVERDRIAAARRLQREYGGVIVLKGAGTVVACAATVALCPAGNPGMASGGMGDVLTGIIAGLLAQGLGLAQAAETGVYAHALAADKAAANGERGLLASDVLACLRETVNP
ncbi:MAG: NAD(P)H-hydrate dehydratase [Gammaproteobacteria bacterium]|nr:NAD(P)H-hydrate dehydratase [Gammaproteobacteria bacterium]MBU1725959.1 NAD(P)H-hydrate dehydratase [Gammaproteobacteria bacterium]MBU2006063.1 NAD(P)H-hydrate dehydratase [Gammaproteobacteria bacterium]